MSIPENKKELVELFEKSGADETEQWAESQLSEGIPQLLRYMFLKSAWEYVVSEGNTSWIQKEISGSKTNPNAPYSGLGLALERCLNKGVDKSDITEIARCLQTEKILGLGYLVGAPIYTMHENL